LIWGYWQQVGQGSRPLSFADAHTGWKHTPAICHVTGYGFQVAALLRGNGDEVPGGGAFPEPDFAVELDVYEYPFLNNLGTSESSGVSGG